MVVKDCAKLDKTIKDTINYNFVVNIDSKYTIMTTHFLSLKIVLALFLFSLLLACDNTIGFSQKERELIYSESENSPFRVLQVTNYDDSLLLRTSCHDIDIHNNRDLKPFINRLKATLLYENGIGIAAPQVGISKNIFLFIPSETPDSIVVAINPKIINRSKKTICFERDGCLSIPNKTGNSIRYSWIEVEYYNETGVLIKQRLEGHCRETGLTAVVFQHEYDHLLGALFTDKLCISL